MAIEAASPFQAHRVEWDGDFLASLVEGAGSGRTLVDLATDHQLGSGDIAILVERDRFVAATAFRRSDVSIWTNDDQLRAYA